jgi:hypothetical protein
MRSDGRERREFQRLALNPPVTGTLGISPVTIVEIGVLGARVRHERPLNFDTGDLRFAYRADEIGMRCEIVRAINKNESGVRFVSAIGDGGDKLRDMLAELVANAFESRRAVPKNTMNRLIVDGDRTVRGKDAGYLSFRLEDGAWKKRRVFLPEQPQTGFTVASSSDGEELRHLCTVYESSDDEGRRLIRLFAELSVSDALDIPPQG